MKKKMRSLAVLLTMLMLVTALPIDVSGASENVMQEDEIVLEQEEDKEIIEVPESEDVLGTALPEAEVEENTQSEELEAAEEEEGIPESDVEEVPEAPSDPALDSRRGNVTSEYGTVIESGDCGANGSNLTWTVYNGVSGYTLVITGRGVMKDYTILDKPGWSKYDDTIKKLILENGITKIGNMAFWHYEKLSGELVIPESVRIIGDKAFWFCTGLIGNLIIPDSVESVGEEAFLGCSGLSGELVLSSHLKNIGTKAFSSCSFQGNLNLPETLENIGSGAFMWGSGFSGNVVIHNSVKAISEDAFTGCRSLQSFTVLNENCLIFDSSSTIPARTIYGYENSSAQRYANKYNRTFIKDHNYTCTTTEPTCTEDGTEVYTCTICGDCYVIDIPASGHTEIIDEGIPATCTADGKTDGKHCSVCGATIEEQVSIPATGHIEVIDDAIASTCTESGLTEGTHCSICNEVIKIQETVPALGHTEEKDEAVKATCSIAGLTEGSHCSVCGEVIKTQEIVPATEHTIVIEKAVSPTCTKTGKTEGSHCSVCNTVIKEQKEIPVASHTYKFDKLTKATLTANGKIIRKCTACGKSATQILSYPKTITLSATKYTYNGKAMKPTVTVKGADGEVIHPANYSVTYSAGCKNVGKYNVVITFKGNYSGKVTRSFTINKAAQVLTASNHTKVFGNAPFFTGIKRTKGDGKLSFTSSNTKIATVSGMGKITIKGIGKTTITITTAATKNYNKATKAITVTVNPKATYISSVTSASAGKMTVKWNKNTTVTGYQVQYATNSSFSGAKTITVAKNSAVSTSVSNLTKGKTYYVRVRTYKKVYSTVYYSSWSAKKTVFEKPKFYTVMIEKTERSTHWMLVSITNTGTKPIRILGNGARSIDRDFDRYNRKLKLATVRNNNIVELRYVEIDPGESEIITFYTSSPTWYDRYTSVLYRISYNSKVYMVDSSACYGSSIIMEE
ncbi:leucine-rich repeat protein [Ruminococcus sp. OA3]|uniref:leucine-rich repeat protein n=1 Tax=Ruminococcus sp. OA3 TaxID=2914164 RepID=UPI001F057EE7|nr:leucine-rich repeat protein [Ruminococcus sp. OA3]MCH1982713.1 leucine-rich repeat protein [Ruminococcus sp. OA3]